MSLFRHRALCALLLLTPAARAEAPVVKQLSIQRARDVTYFHLRLEVPSDLGLPSIDFRGREWKWRFTAEARRRLLARLPRLVPRDGKTSAVYFRLSPSGIHASPEALDFVGKVEGDGRAKFLLLYSTDRQSSGNGEEFLPEKFRPRWWGEAKLKVDLDKARRLKRFRGERDADDAPRTDDLEGLWAEAQARHFAVLEAQSSDFGFYGFARAATGRKYRVPAKPLKSAANTGPDDEYQRLYEMTTGAAALAESLALRRMLNPDKNQRGRRVHDINKVRGIEIAEHPWKKMMAGKKPAVEPLAELVPHDQYYVAFKTFRKFVEFGELSQRWGGNLTQAYEVHSRDFDLRRRYERQLCLRSTALGKALGPALIRSLVVTGSDFYLREGSDVSVIFHVKNRGLFLAAVGQFIGEAREEHGDQLKEKKSNYKGVTVESFTTPLREVSLHRAAFEDYVVYSNSPAALRRILDTHAGRRKALADALDFRYMRTIFRADDKDEDGFAFLSDAFIRQLVGPASKITAKRRLEALTSLYMLTHGALFHAWETGKLPASHKALLKASRLRPEELYVPEGKRPRWDANKWVAVSDAYNTIHFATPLIELPIDRITADELREYKRFREGYLRNWRRYFDPVGVRLAGDKETIRLEVYILPLVRNSEYDQLRQWTGNRVTTLDLRTISPRTLFQYTLSLKRFDSFGDALGNRVLLRWDDSPVYQHWFKLRVAKDLGAGWEETWRRAARLFFQAPLTLGVRIGNERAFDKKVLPELRGLVEWVGGEFKTKRLKPYKGVTIHRLRFKRDCRFIENLNEPNTPKKERFVPVIYHAKIDGMWYVGFSRDSLHDIIDRAAARKDDKKPRKEETVAINSSVHVSPKAAVSAAKALRALLEWETHKRALENEPLWLPLYRGGILPKDADEKTAAAAARKFFGFVPVSPDGAAYRYDAKTGEVVNARHGSLRRPRLHAAPDDSSPVSQLLGRLQTLRADLRFREDGIHTVLTIRRQPPQK